MKSFVFRSVVFFGLVTTIVLGGLATPSKVPGGSLHQALAQKHDRLRESDSRPRVIIVGGSNASLGIYSPMIEEAFAVNVVNVAVTVGYGLKYMLDDLRPYLRESDLVVVVPEYDHFFGAKASGGAGLVESLLYVPENIRLLDFKQWRTVIANAPQVALQRVRLWLKYHVSGPASIRASYSLQSFNDYGDFVGHWDDKPRPIRTFHISGRYSPDAIMSIERFAKIAADRGADVCLSFPSLNQSSLKANEQAVDHVAKQLHESMLPIIGSPQRYSFSDANYYDTHYHLMKPGQLERTSRLIADLNRSGLLTTDSNAQVSNHSQRPPTR